MVGIEKINKYIDKAIEHHEEYRDKYNKKIKILNKLDDILKYPYKYVIVKNYFCDNLKYYPGNMELNVSFNFFIKPDMKLVIRVFELFYDEYSFYISLVCDNEYADIKKDCGGGINISGPEDWQNLEEAFYKFNSYPSNYRKSMNLNSGYSKVVNTYISLMKLLKPYRFDDYLKYHSTDKEFISFMVKNKKNDYKQRKFVKFYNLW